MTIIRTPEEVYKKYIDEYGYDGDGDPDAIALFAYALVEKDKYDWVEHHRKENNGKTPSHQEIEQWYACKPENYFKERVSFAVNWYKAFARTLLEDEIEEQKLEAIRKYIGDRLKFLSQLWVGLVTNFIFVLLLGAIAAYVFADFSPIAWIKSQFLSAHTPKAH